MIFDNVRVVKLVENCDLLHDAVNVILELLFVEYLDGDKMFGIVVVIGLENSSKGTNSKHLCL